MNRSELIQDVASRAGVSVKEATKQLETVVAAISDGVTIEGTVSIPGFGTFTAKQVEARVVRNPSTGEPIHKPATRRAGFKAGCHLKAQVAGETPVKAAGAR